MIGLDSQKVMLTDYNNEWISCFESEASIIKDALGNEVIDIQHIGSTSVVGLKAKPIIDILVGLQSFDQIDEIIGKMEALGYTYAHWAGIDQNLIIFRLERRNIMAVVLDGKALSKQIEEELAARVKIIIERTGKVPALATILVGDDPSSEIYVNMKGNACKRVGLTSKKIALPKETTTAELLEVIDGLNSDPEIFGILLQHPVPGQINERECFDRIALHKDVDGVTALGFGRMAMGEKVFRCATPGGIMKMLEHYRIDIAGKNAVVVGRSPILGKPMAMMLLNANATVTICHSKTNNLPEFIKKADLVVGAVGKPEFIKADWIKEGAILIDAGYHKGGIGDIELEKAKEKCAAYTPVPGGVGPMTIATLISQTVESAEKILQL